MTAWVIDLDTPDPEVAPCWPEVCRAVRERLGRDLERAASRLLGLNQAEFVRRKNGTTSLFGVGCPFGCPTRPTPRGDDDSPIYLSSNGHAVHCASCGERSSLIDLACERAGLDPSADKDECATHLQDLLGLGSLAPLAPSQVGRKVCGGGARARRPAASAGDMPPRLQAEYEDKLAAFAARVARGRPLPRERIVLEWIERVRGIPREAVVRAGIFVDDRKAKVGGAWADILDVVQVARDTEGRIAGYQRFDYIPVHGGAKPQYKACPSSRGSSRWPAGVETCSGDHPILVVAGFFDGPSALAGGVKAVLNTFGKATLTRSAEHLRPVIEGKSIWLLFDRDADEVRAALQAGEAMLRAGAADATVLKWGPSFKERWDLNDLLVEVGKGGTIPRLRHLLRNGQVTSEPVCRCADGGGSNGARQGAGHGR